MVPAARPVLTDAPHQNNPICAPQLRIVGQATAVQFRRLRGGLAPKAAALCGRGRFGSGAVAAGDGTSGVMRRLRTLLGGKAERFGMGPAVVLGQRFAEGAGPVGHGALADLAAGDRELGDSDGKTTRR
jgi:hypothetical protein